MTPTLGDFLTIAGQRIAAAEAYRGRRRVAGHADVIAELDRLLTVMARYACDGADRAGNVTSPVPTTQELTIIGIRLTLLRAAESIHRSAQTAGTPARTGHPAAADLRAATDALIAGRHRPPGQPDWPSPSAAACWRHNALAAAIIGHNSELILRALADRGRQLGLPGHHQEALQQTAGTTRNTWQSWQAVTRAWDPLTTGTSNRPSLIAAELDDLVLWIGRLARTGTWTPARASTGPPRPPADLARTPDDVTITLVAVGRTIDAAGWIYSPARLLPDSDDLVHVYRYRHASPGRSPDSAPPTTTPSPPPRKPPPPWTPSSPACAPPASPTHSHAPSSTAPSPPLPARAPRRSAPVPQSLDQGPVTSSACCTT